MSFSQLGSCWIYSWNVGGLGVGVSCGYGDGMAADIPSQSTGMAMVSIFLVACFRLMILISPVVDSTLYVVVLCPLVKMIVSCAGSKEAGHVRCSRFTQSPSG